MKWGEHCEFELERVCSTNLEWGKLIVRVLRYFDVEGLPVPFSII